MVRRKRVSLSPTPQPKKRRSSMFEHVDKHNKSIVAR